MKDVPDLGEKKSVPVREEGELDATIKRLFHRYDLDGSGTLNRLGDSPLIWN